MPSSTIDSLNIEITSNSRKATGSIHGLVNSLRSLAWQTEKTLTGLRALNEELKKISGIKRNFFGNITGDTAGGGASSGNAGGVGRVKQVTSAIQAQINAVTGVDRITKSAAASAKVFDQQLGKQEVAARKVASAVKSVAEETKKATGAGAAADAKPILYRPDSPEERQAFRDAGRRQWEESKARIKEHQAAVERAKEAYLASIRKTGPDPILSGAAPAKGAMEANILRSFGANPNTTDPIYQSAVAKYEKATKQTWNPASLLQGASNATAPAASAIQNVNSQLDSTSKVGEAASASMGNVANQLNNSATAGANASGAINNTAESTRQLREEADRANRSGGAFTGLLRRVGRIASTMLIRNALKLLMKSFGDAWNSAKAFSQSMGGAFAKTVSDTNAIVKNTAVSIIQTFAPALTALLPVIYTVGAAIQFICSLIQSLLSLLGITSEMFGVNASKISKYGNATSGAGKSTKQAAKETKNLLASWDELNIIQSTTKSGGNGGGGGSGKGGSNGKLSDLVNKEISAISSFLVGETLLAVGLILACTGHVAPGIGLMVLGAASIAKTLTVDWGKLPTEVKKRIAIVAGVAGGAMMALGAVIAFSAANIPLGIGLMALGAASIIGSVALSWNLDERIEDRIAHVTAIAGGALLALGAVFAFTGASIPVGIGLMLLGASSLAGSVALSWNLDEEVKKKIASITAYAGISLLAIGAVLAFTGAQLPVGIGMMIAGAATLASSVALSWNLDKEVRAKITNITTIAGASLLAIGAILACTGANIPLGVGMMIAGGVSLAAAVALNWDELTSKVTEAFHTIGTVVSEIWDGVKKKLQEVWNTVSVWWDTNIAKPVETAWQSVSDFFGTLFGDADTQGSIANFASNAWAGVSIWWDEGIAKPVESAWQSVTDFFGTLFGGADVEGSIASYASDAWAGVTMWWDTSIAKPVDSAWQGVSSFFGTLFGDSETPGSVASYARSAYSSVSTWWNNNVSKNFEKEGAWGAVKGFFKGIFVGEDGNGGIVGFASSAWSSLTKLWDNNIGELLGLDTAWGGVSAFFENLFGLEPDTGISGLFTSLWNDISQLWNTDFVSLVEAAWSGISTWFNKNVTDPIKNAFTGAINWIISLVNDVIGAMNSIGSFTIPGWGFALPDFLGGGKVGWDASKVTLWSIPTIKPLEYAEGGYGIPRGDLFIANEAGAELVGNMNGKTTVANQGQIVEGIQRGVRDANSDQNRLLSEQNSLLRALLEKTGNLSVSPSLSWSNFNKANDDIYSKTTGR